MERLKKRAEFQAVAAGKRVSRPGFVLQARASTGDRHRPPRFGFTVTRRIGNAVVRNRIRRRLKEAVRLSGAEGRMRAPTMCLSGVVPHCHWTSSVWSPIY